MRAPPERPIVSACGSIMENASHYIEHHIKEIGMQHPTFLEDKMLEQQWVVSPSPHMQTYSWQQLTKRFLNYQKT